MACGWHPQKSYRNVSSVTHVFASSWYLIVAFACQHGNLNVCGAIVSRQVLGVGPKGHLLCAVAEYRRLRQCCALGKNLAYSISEVLVSQYDMFG